MTRVDAERLGVEQAMHGLGRSCGSPARHDAPSAREPCQAGENGVRLATISAGTAESLGGLGRGGGWTSSTFLP